MAEKEIVIKVTTDTDVSKLEDLNGVLDTTTGKADEIREALVNALKEVEDEADALADELAKIEFGESDADYDEVAQQLEDATDRANALQEALNEIDSGNLQNANSDAEDLAGGLDGARENADALSDSMGLIESTMLMDMANQLGAIGDSAEGMAQELDTASISVGQLATNTGIAEPQMRDLIAHISNVTFPQNEAIAYVNVLNQMGIHADKLGDSATNMDRINDATGMGYEKVMLLTQGLQSMGITADNLPASFNAIAYAQANVGGGAETLQQVLRRQAGALNEYGMDVDATVVALSSLQRQTGLTGMKLGSEFASRLKDCNGDLSALEQSLGLQAGALSNASAETSNYEGKLQQLADEEMEHKTLTERLGAVWDDFALKMDWLISPLSSVVGLIGSFGQFALSANSIITLAQTFGILTGATETATIAQLELNLAFLSNPITWIVLAIIALIVVLGYLYFNNEQVRNAINGLGEAFVNVGQIIYNSVVNFVNWVITSLQGLYDYIMTFGGLLKSNVSITGNKIIDSVLAVMIFIATLPYQLAIIFTNMIAKSLGFGDNFVQNLINAGVNAVNGFVSWIVQLPSKLGEELNKMLEMAGQFALDIADRLSFGGASMVVGWLTGSGEHSPGFMYDALVSELLAMVNAPAEHLTALFDWLKDNGYELANAITEAFFGISFDEYIANLNWLHNTIMGVVDYVYTVGGLLPAETEITGNRIIDTIIRVIGFIFTLPMNLALVFTDMVAKTLGFGDNFTAGLRNGISHAVQSFVNIIQDIPRALQDCLNWAYEIVMNSPLGQALQWLGDNASWAFSVLGLGQQSPGKIVKSLRKELNWAEEAVYNSDLSVATGKLGDGLTSSFNPVLETGNAELRNIVVNGATGGDTYNFTFNDTVIDNEDRMEKIMEYIRRNINWNNKTAGRSV